MATEKSTISRNSSSGWWDSGFSDTSGSVALLSLETPQSCLNCPKKWNFKNHQGFDAPVVTSPRAGSGSNNSGVPTTSQPSFITNFNGFYSKVVGSHSSRIFSLIAFVLFSSCFYFIALPVGNFSLFFLDSR